MIIFIPSRIATFSIAAVSSDGVLAAGTSSHYLAVGGLVPYVKTDTGVVLTQSMANPSRVDAIFDILDKTKSLDNTIDAFLVDDEFADDRQVAVLDKHGRSVSFSGKNCVSEVEVLSGNNFIALGNMLKRGTVTKLSKTYSEMTSSGNDILESIVDALLNAEKKYGDKRGRLSSALIAKKNKSGYGGSDTLVDLRVDASKDPCMELKQLFEVRKMYLTSYVGSKWHNLDNLSSTHKVLLKKFISISAEPDISHLFCTHNFPHLYSKEKNSINERFFASIPYYLDIIS